MSASFIAPGLAQAIAGPEKPWRINMMPMGRGDFYLYLHGDVRRASNTKVRDTVRVEIQFDAAYRNGPMHPMPAWFRVPLAKNAKAIKGWRALIPRSGKRGRFMGREW